MDMFNQSIVQNCLSVTLSTDAHTVTYRSVFVCLELF